MTSATLRYDRSAILKDAWGRARQAAAEAAQGVRAFIGAAMRTAWSCAKAALRPAPTPRRYELGAYATVSVPCGADGEDHVTVTLTFADGTVRTLGAVLLYSEDYDGPFGVLEEALRVIGHTGDSDAQPPAEEPATQPVEPEPEPAPEPLRLDLGRGRVIRDEKGIRFYGEVTGGGANGPGLISEATGFSSSERVRWTDDRRSGSGRSGSVVWTLKPDRLYYLANVAYNSSRSENYYLSTFDNDLTELSLAGYKAKRARLWPLEAYEAEQAEVRRAEAEAARVVAERAEVERLKAEAEARKLANAEEAARIEREGQPVVEGLPALKGSPKQVAYALKIRAAVQALDPADRALKTATTASYWIDNRRSALWA